jgi:chromosome segregation ATPase
VTAEQARARLSGYRAAQRRLDRRLHALRRDATDAELTDSEEARRRMRRQSEEFRRAVDEEAERLEEIRGRLQALLSHSREQGGSG